MCTFASAKRFDTLRECHTAALDWCGLGSNHFHAANLLAYPTCRFNSRPHAFAAAHCGVSALVSVACGVSPPEHPRVLAVRVP